MSGQFKEYYQIFKRTFAAQIDGTEESADAVYSQLAKMDIYIPSLNTIVSDLHCNDCNVEGKDPDKMWHMEITTELGVFTAHPGDWILVRTKGQLSVLPDVFFKKSFREYVHTFEAWEESELDFDEFCPVGSLVDEDLCKYILGIPSKEFENSEGLVWFGASAGKNEDGENVYHRFKNEGHYYRYLGKQPHPPGECDNEETQDDPWMRILLRYTS